MMYLEHFGLLEAPFSIAPNPRYLYLTHQHQEALAHLSYGMGSAGGVVLLTGEVGTGKTTISRKLLEDIPEHIDIAWIVNPRLSAQELLASFCDELSICYDVTQSSIKTFTDLINLYLIEAHGQGRNVVLMIDEAQNLSPEVLEQLRLLTNLETSERKLLQIILLGQPELKEMLERVDMRQLAQRVTAHFHLVTLNKEESSEYIRHRLSIAGCNRQVFTKKSIDLIFSVSHGTPRLINLLCDRALLGVYSCNGDVVEVEHVQQASQELLGDEIEHPKASLVIPLMVAFVLLIANVILLDKTRPWLSNQIEPVHAHFSQDEVDRPVAVQPAQLARYSIATRDHQEQSSAAVVSENTTSTEHVIADARHDVSSGFLKTTLRQQEKASRSIAKVNIEAEASEQGEPKPADDDISMHPPAGLAENSLWQVIETSGTKLLAFQTLASLWHRTITGQKIKPCEQLANKNLFCLQQRTNSWLLREYNRPAIFQVTSDDNKKRFAVIRSVRKGRAVIQLGQLHWDIALSELEQYWQGKTTLIWAKPAAYDHDIQAGDDGAMIPWLAEQMDRIQGEMIPPQVFQSMNSVLIARVKDFQLAEGLPSDGIVEPLTLMRMNEHINQNIPLLNRNGGD